MAVKDRIRKQIKKQNAPELTKEQIVGKIEREVKRKHREKKRSCWKRKVVYYRINLNFLLLHMLTGKGDIFSLAYYA